MRPVPKMLLSLLCCATPLTGCGGDRLVPEVSVVPLQVPPSLLSCAPPPAARPVDSQRDVALLIVDLAEAGADCRTKLAAVRRVVQPEP